MKLLQWTLFVDMLGYREVNGSIYSDKDAEEFIEFMEANKNILDYSNRDKVKERYKKDEFDLYEYYEVHSCFVSDSIIITYKPKEVEKLANEEEKFMHSANALFIICMRLQTLIFHCFMERGIFLRGGISSKYAYIKDSFAVGEGVIEAYLAESSIAKYPRIVLHPNVEENEKLIEKIKFLSDVMYGGKSLIQRDDKDGILFLDYIGHALSSSDLNSAAVARSAAVNPLMFLAQKYATLNYVRRHYEALKNKIGEIESGLKQAESESKEYEQISRVLSKFIWLKEYHNRSIAGIKELEGYLVA
ncbi:hypothetical protein [Microbulbifer hainanensis]|uniref:hypothetical protein n=1 Tax=Microbulbifer hainanensis TaxID=2735675 RepID=UPI0018675DB5|nr:hypothetical protein [Microbulbifer hainanensis]